MERISEYFEGAAWKYLTAVDAEPDRSNQHEFGGLPRAGFLQYLGDPGTGTIRFPARFVYLTDDEISSFSVEGQVSWYDSRRGNPSRGPEYRLYYDSNAVTSNLREGMFMLVAKRPGDEIVLVFTEAGSSSEQQLHWLFDLGDGGYQFRRAPIEERLDKPTWAAHWILEQIGVEPEPTETDWLEPILKRFGPTFPPTKQFSAFACEVLGGGEPRVNPDETLFSLIETEEKLFRVLERYLVERRLEDGFDGVEPFIKYSLSVQNRRKSRVGYAFENHLEYIFSSHELPFDRGARTENRASPDFLFPGAREYHDEDYPGERLTMLGVKSTCKDRWRQVLSEAARIPRKHLATLEPGISAHQIEEMRSNSLQLVVPTPLHETYKAGEAERLMSLAEFIRHIRDRTR